MNIKQLEKANKLISLIKEYDEQINRLDKIAIELSNGATSSISISVEAKKEDKAKSSVLDSDGSILDEQNESMEDYMNRRLREYITPFTFHGGSCTGNKDKSNKILFEDTLSDSDSLMVINVLVFRKKQQRQRLINQVEKISFA